MLAAENVATPATAAIGPPPDSVPPPALVPMARVTGPVKPVAVLLLASRAVTCTAGVIVAPADVVLGCTENTSCVAVPAVILNAALVPVAGPVALAVRVYAVPTLLIDRPVNVTTPPDAAWVAVPDKAPPDGLVPMTSVTLPVKPVAVFPFASRAVTSTAGVMLAPATAPVGCTVNTWVAALPAVTLNAVLVPVAGPVALAVRVYAVPTLSMLAAENVATPATAASGPPPDSVPPPALVPMASVTLPVNPVAVLPFASRAVTSTAGAMLAPATVLVGCTVNTSVPALPAVMLKPALGPVRPPLLEIGRASCRERV